MSMYNFNIYGFVEDTFLQRQPRIIVNNEDDQGVGKLNSVLVDYFASPVRMRDIRSGRNTFIGFTTKGQMDILFDRMVMDYPEILEQVSNDYIIELFNILECIIYTHPSQVSVLNDLLTNHSPLGSYIDSSVVRSTDTTNCLVETAIGYETIPIPKWFQVKIKWVIGEDTYVIHFKMYVDSLLFASNYPIVSITKVVPPFNPSYFFNKFTSEDILANIVEAQNYTAPSIHDTVKVVDQSGMYLFSVRYKIDSAKYAYIPFQIYYKGSNKPKDINCRIAIREYLTNLSIVEESVLKEYFPDLYLENSFYLVPLWDDYIVRPTKNIYSSITRSFHHIWSKFNNIISIPQTDFMSKCSLLTNGQNNIFTVVYGNPLNTDTNITLKDIYPTFIDYSTHEINFEYMDMKDRQFAILLNKAFAILSGDMTMDAGYKYYSEDGREYLVFSTDSTEILILTPTSYNQLQQ